MFFLPQFSVVFRISTAWVHRPIRSCVLGIWGRKPPPTVRPAPPPPAPKPINSNLELRGFFKFQEIWHFAIFDKVKNRGFWLKKGESFDDGKVQIESFNLDTESIKMKGRAKPNA